MNRISQIFPQSDWLISALMAAGFLLLSAVSGFAQSLNPVFSHEAGFYTQEISLQISVDHPDATIYFTTDGSVPDTGSEIYEAPLQLASRAGDPNVVSEIPTNNLQEGHPYRENWLPPSGEVFKIHVIRAVAYLPNLNSGDVVTASYIVDEQGLSRYSMPVFSLAVNPEDFWGEDGIYVPGATGENFNQRGREWERDIHIEFYEDSGERVLAQNGGARIHGGSTRNRPRKSLRLYARSDYGESWFNYPFFPDKPVNRHKRFLLRNSGNDWSESVFRDAFIQRIFQNNTNIDMQHSRPAIVFINGEYWGIHNIRDRYDHRYLQEHYGVDNERVTILENNAVLDSGSEEGRQHFLNLRTHILLRDMADPDEFAWVEERMDMHNFIDYQVFNIYARNTDWPGNNVRFWRYNDGTPDGEEPHPLDGRWRWMAFDLDFGFSLNFDYVLNFGAAYGGNDAFHNTLEFATDPSGPGWPNPPWSTSMLRNLLDNPGFRNDFINRFADHLNTSFRADQVLSVLDGFITKFEPEMEEHIHRWNEPAPDHWLEDLSRIETFALQREDAMRDIINGFFEAGGIETISVDINNANAGRVKINRLLLDSSVDGIDHPVYPWNGFYFREIPVTLTAIPEAGYRFDGWVGDVTSSSETIEISLNTATSVTAQFSAEPFDGDEMNPPPHRLSDGPYTFSFWSPDEPESSFPPHMVFQQSSVSDPALETEMTHPYHIPFNDEDDNEYHPDDAASFGFPYRLTRRTRLNGLGNDGISMINTGRGRDLGAVVLALDTQLENNPGLEGIRLTWQAQTLQLNSRNYHLRLQYRIGLFGDWQDVLLYGEPVEYVRNPDTDAVSSFNHILGPEFLDHAYLQLRWKYYYTGVRDSEDSGARDEIRLGNITVNEAITSVETPDRPGKVNLSQNYPNPFNPETAIRFYLPEAGEVKLEVFDLLGRKTAELVSDVRHAGTHTVRFNATGLATGVYIYRLTTGDVIHTRKMLFIK